MDPPRGLGCGFPDSSTHLESLHCRIAKITHLRQKSTMAPVSCYNDNLQAKGLFLLIVVVEIMEKPLWE